MAAIAIGAVAFLVASDEGDPPPEKSDVSASDEPVESPPTIVTIVRPVEPESPATPEERFSEDLRQRTEMVASDPESVPDCPEQTGNPEDGFYDDNGQPTVVVVLRNDDGCLHVHYEPLPEGRSIEEAAELVKESGGDDVLSAGEPILGRIDSHDAAGDPRQWHHELLQASEWTSTPNPNEVTVAVIDTGVDASHLVFGDRLTQEESRNSDQSHGTMVAGTIAQLSGSSVKIKHWDRSVACADGELKCIDYLPVLAELADPKRHRDVKVVNLSLGCVNQQACISQFENGGRARTVINALREQGKVVVASAGNDYDGNADDWPRTPVGYDGVVGVAAHNREGALTAYSNRGDYVDFTAPSGDCDGYAFDAAEGAGECGVMSRDESLRLVVPMPGGGYRETTGGTSAAAPTVSAVIAQLWSACAPSSDDGEIRDAVMAALRSTAGTQPDLPSGGERIQIRPKQAADELSCPSQVLAPTPTTITTTTTIPKSVPPIIEPEPPDTPGSPSVSGGSGSLSVTWDAPDGNGSAIDRYEVRWRQSGSSSWSDRIVGASSRRYEISGLPAGVDFEVQVRARNGVDWGGWSGSGSASTSAEEPDAPGGLSVSGGSGSLSVTWDAPDDNGSAIRGYEVRWRRSGSSSWSERTVVSSPRNYEIRGLRADTEFQLQVRARNGAGWGAWSDVALGHTSTPRDYPTVQPAPRVRLFRGDPGPTTAPRTGDIPCGSNSPNCVWLDIRLENFEPGAYVIYCTHDGWNNGEYRPGYFQKFSVTVGSSGQLTRARDCYINIDRTDGNGVRVVVQDEAQENLLWNSGWLR